MSNPTGGAALGTATTTAKIVGDYAKVALPFDTALTIRREWGVNVLTWAGGGQLQRADKPTGPWQTLTTATNPWTVQSPVPTTYYRVTLPRPVNLYVPSSYTGQTILPLVIMVHGYYSDAATYEGWMNIQPLAEARGFLYCYPNGTTDRRGEPFWNATDGCYGFYNSEADDAGYLRGLIEEISAAVCRGPQAGTLVWNLDGRLYGLSDGLRVRGLHRGHRRGVGRSVSGSWPLSTFRACEYSSHTRYG